MKIVFHGSAYQLSTSVTYSFWILYSIEIFASLVSYYGLLENTQLYAIGWTIGCTVTLTLAVFLPSLFIYKLYQINQKVMDDKPRSLSQSGSTSTGSNAQETVNTFLVLIRKYTILTIVSLISSWVVFVCGMIEIFYGFNFELSVIWGYSLILDVNSNLLCIMLSNVFGHGYYMKIFGCIDKCVENNCCKKSEDRVQNELSSYIEETDIKPSQIEESDAEAP